MDGEVALQLLGAEPADRVLVGEEALQLLEAGPADKVWVASLARELRLEDAFWRREAGVWLPVHHLGDVVGHHAAGADGSPVGETAGGSREQKFLFH